MFFAPLLDALEKGKPILRKKFCEEICRTQQIESILNFNSQFLKKLEDRLSDWSPSQRIGDLFLEAVISP